MTSNNRLNNSFQEAEMEKASMGTVMISRLIASLPSEGNEVKIKERLLKLYSETPNPSEDDLQKFLTTIKEMESIVTASELKNTADGRVRRVPELKQEETKQDNPHFLCGKAHKKGQCAQICKGCKMKGSHKEEQCWVLHPQLRPKD